MKYNEEEYQSLDYGREGFVWFMNGPPIEVVMMDAAVTTGCAGVTCEAVDLLTFAMKRILKDERRRRT